MKKSIVLIGLLAVIGSASAQTMKVQSAYSDMKNERLANAKMNIDEACQNEKTIKDPKTWNYAGLIYAQFVDASNNNEKLFKKQMKELTKNNQEMTVQAMCQRGIDCFRQSLELEKEQGTSEYSASSINALKVLCGYSYMYAGKVYNDGKYQEAVPMFQQLVKDAELAKHKDIQMDALYYEADCYRMLKQPENEMNLYRELAKLNTEKADVYLKIYTDNRKNNDTVKAINALKKGVKMTAEDEKNNIVMRSTLAQAYIWAGQQENADKTISEILSGKENNTLALNQVANIYVDMGQTDKAKELFEKSLAIDANQFDAYRGLGLAYFNKAADGYRAADKIPMDQQEAYDKAISDANADFTTAIPYFEKARTIKDNDFTTLKALKTIYSKLGKGNTPEYQEVSAKLNELIQK